MPDPKTVAVVGPDGSPVLVPEAAAADIVDAHGHVMSPAEVAQAQREVALEKKLGGVEGYVGPALAGAARGISAGLSDPAILAAAEAIGGEGAREAVRTRLNDYRDYNPQGSEASELLGMAGGALVGGEGGIIGGITRGGRALEAGATRALGEGIAGRVVGGALSGAGEAAAYAAGKTASDAALENAPLTGEKLVAGMGHSLLYGAGLGAAGGFLGGSLSGLRAPSRLRTVEEEAGPGLALQRPPRRLSLSSEDLDAGLRERVATGEGPIHFDGAERRPVQLRPDVGLRGRVPTEEAPLTFAGRLGIDADAGLAARGQGGRFQGAIPAEDALKLSSAKRVTREVRIDGTELGEAAIGRGPIRLGDVDAAASPASGLRPPAPRTFGDRLAQAADVKTIKSLGGSAGDLRKLEDTVPGGYRRVAKDIREDLEKTTGKTIGFHDRESLHEYAVARKEALGEELGGMLKKLDDAKTGITPDQTAFAEAVSRKLLDPMIVRGEDGAVHVLAGHEKQFKAASAWLENVAKPFADRPATFAEWQQMRVALDKEIYASAAKASPKTETLRQVRRLMEDELTRAGEEAAQRVGGSFRDQYNATKRIYQSVAKAEEMTARGVSRELANNSVGLRSSLAAMSGLATGHFGLGAVAGLGMKLVQDRGDMLAADLLSRAGTIGGVARLTGDVTGRLQGGVKALVEAAGSAPRAARNVTAQAAAREPPGKTQTARYVDATNAITGALANPAKTADRLAKTFAPLDQHAPKVSNAAIETTLRGIGYLNSIRPPSRFDQFSLQPQFQPRARASDMEIGRFMRASEAVGNPLIVLEEAKKGTLTRDHVEAVKAVYPEMYTEMRTEVMKSLATAESQVPYGTRIQLGILLDLPTDKTLSPAFLREVQATYENAVEAGAETSPQTIAAPEIAGPVQTATQSAVARTG